MFTQAAPIPMPKTLAHYFLVPFAALLLRCSGTDAPKVDDPSGFEGRKFPKYNINTADNTPGLQGIYDVPEMLSLCRLDSGALKQLPEKVVADFALLEKDMAAIGTGMGGPQGIIYYNTDPANFKFETVLLINKMPSKTPENCQIVVLEASYMLVYNYFGPFAETTKAYEVLRKYMNDNFLEASGPAREFYPELPPDAAADEQQIRILLPVKRVKPAATAS